MARLAGRGRGSRRHASLSSISLGIPYRRKTAGFRKKAVESKSLLPNIDGEIDKYYSYLDIIDGKAGVVLTFNGIMLAVIGIWLEYIPFNIMHMLLDIIFIMYLISSYMILKVSELYFAKSRVDVGLEATVLLRRDACNRSVFVSRCATFLIISVSVLHGIGTFMLVTPMCDAIPGCRIFYSQKYFSNIDYKSGGAASDSGN
ncbi:hypothetical protein V5F53_15010 [Xanthobacter sp. V4C-4]|uniref:hypothetical protein n=1 Tax=Xanthobacter cornucopiae TaxID=3119924 RepID=UPI00372B7C26